MNIDRLIQRFTHTDISQGINYGDLGKAKVEHRPISTTIGFTCLETGLPNVIAGASESVEKTRKRHESHGDQVEIIKEEYIRVLR